MSSQIKYGYTDGNDFTLNNAKYTGDYNVLSSGDVYTGRLYSSSSKKLEPKSNYSTDLIRSSYFKDRYPLDDITLPYMVDDVLLHSGELVNYVTFNEKIGMLHNNLLYIYSKMFLCDTDLPYNYNYTAGISKQTGVFDWYNTSNYTSFGSTPFATHSTLSVYAEIDNIKRFVIIPYTTSTNFTIVGISNTHVVGLTSTGNFSEIGVVHYTNVIDNFSSEKCQNLSDITYDGKNLFICDSKINGGGQVFKYDVSSYFTGDPAFENRKYLIKPVGGLGGLSNAGKYNGPTVLGSKENTLLVYDSGNKAIKIYDNNLIWKKTIALPRRHSYNILDIRYRDMTGYFYALFQDYTTNQYGMFIITDKFKLQGSVIFEDDLYPETDIAFKRMIISRQDSNVFYLLTNTTIFKKFFNHPEKTNSTFSREKFGQRPIFLWNSETIEFRNEGKTWNYLETAPDTVLQDIDILPTSNTEDSLFAWGNSSMFHFSEKTLYNSLLRDNTLPYFNLDKINLEKGEYVQALTLNKEIYKILKNLLQLTNTLKGKFLLKYDFYGDLSFEQYKYLTNAERSLIYIEQNLSSFISENELIQPGVLNRVIKKIVAIQENLLKVTKPEISNYRTRITNDNVYHIA